MKKKVVIGGALVLALVGAPSATWMIRRASATTSEVTRGTVQESVVAAGVVASKAGIADVRARSEGRVVRVLVREGDRVLAGQLLAEIDNAEMKAVLTRLEAEQRAFSASATAVTRGARVEERTAAEADLRAAQHSLLLAQDHAKRIGKLHESGSESEQAAFAADGELEIAKAHVEQARARRDLASAGGRSEDVAVARDRVAAADASLDEARQRLERTKIVAPIGGVILARRIDEGDTVEASLGTTPSLFEIADPTMTEVAAEVEEPDAVRVREGLAVTITMPGGRTVLAQGTVSRLGARVQKRTIGADDARLRAEAMVRTVWIAWSQNGMDPMPIGKRVEAVIRLPEREVLARVPRSAVIVKDGHAQVEVPWGPLTRSRVVTLGATDENFVEVKGIDVGMRVFAKRD